VRGAGEANPLKLLDDFFSLTAALVWSTMITSTNGVPEMLHMNSNYGSPDTRTAEQKAAYEAYYEALKRADATKRG
jgi:hypothetical protein